MEERGAISPAQVDQWIDSAEPGQQLRYAWGGDLPRFAPGVKAVQRLRNQGLVGFVTRRPSPGRVDYVMFRLNKRRADDDATPSRPAAPPETPEAIILHALRRAAARGQPCPTNDELARKAQLPDAYAASYVVCKLRKAGKIHVSLIGPGKRRVVTIAGSGARTRMERA